MNQIQIHALKLFWINKMNLEDKLAICKAWLEGKTIEISRKDKKKKKNNEI